MISDKSKELITKYTDNFMKELSQELEMVGVTLCQLNINFNSDATPKISAEFNMSKRISFKIENGEIFASPKK